MSKIREFFEEPENRRYLIAFLSLILVFALVGGVFYWWSHRSSSVSSDLVPDNQVSLSASEIADAKTVSKNFVNSAGTWGIDPTKINANNIIEIGYLIKTQSPLAPSYFTDRATEYKTVRDAYLIQDSDLWEMDTQISSWVDTDPADNLEDFAVTNIQDATKGAYGSTLTLNGVDYKTYTTTINFDSIETKRIQSATDASWDGTFLIQSKTFTESMDITLVQINNQWKVFKYQGLNDPFVLCTWIDPGDYSSSQFDFQNVGTIKAVLPKEK